MSKQTKGQSVKFQDAMDDNLKNSKMKTIDVLDIFVRYQQLT